MVKEKAQYIKMTETPIPKLVLQLALPTIFSMLITSIYNLADTYFVGQISTAASGAVGIVASLMAIIQACGFMLGHGSGSIVSRKLGSKDEEGATRFTSTGFFASLLLGVLLSVFGLMFLESFVNVLGSTPTILPHAKAYAFYILLAAPVMMASFVMNNVLRYEGKAYLAMIGLVTGGFVNIILDALFILKFGMGTAGAGLATAVSQCVSFVILLSSFLLGKTTSKISLKKVSRSPKELFSILVTGFPSFGRQGLGSIAGMLLNVAARQWGDPAVAAMSIVSRVFLFLFAVILGVGQGFQPVAAFNYGAKKYDRVRKAAMFTLAASFLSVTVFVTVCYIFAPSFIVIFRDDPAVSEIAVPAFRLQTLAMLFQPVVVVSNMLFQSTGKSVRASFLSMCRQGLYFIPLILILPEKLGLLGVQICQPISDFLAFITVIPFFAAFLHELKKL